MAGRPKLQVTKELLYDLYVEQHKSAVSIAKQLKCDHKVVYKYLRLYNIPIRDISVAHKVNLDLELLYKLYDKDKHTICYIGEKFNISKSTVYRKLVEGNITIRPSDKAGIKNAMYGKRGPLAPSYKEPENRIGPLAYLIRTCYKYKSWRTSVYQRDGFSCVLCGDSSGGNLNADHIVPFSYIVKKYNIKSLKCALNCEHLWDVSNGRSLCETCHKRTNTWGYKATLYGEANEKDNNNK